MPWIDTVLPFSGTTPQSAHTSHAGAEDAKGRALSQTIRYMALLREHGGLTDAEAARFMRVERTSINARRGPLVKVGVVVPGGTRQGPTGKLKNVVWKIVGGG